MNAQLLFNKMMEEKTTLSKIKCNLRNILLSKLSSKRTSNKWKSISEF